MGWIIGNKEAEIMNLGRGGGGKIKRNYLQIWLIAVLFWVLLMLATPKIPLSHNHHHLLADMRNLIGVPNTLNVITNFPFLVVGVVGFVLSLQGSFLNIHLRGEVWSWAVFYGGIIGVAFGSAYYHLKPDDGRVMWDILPKELGGESDFVVFLDFFL